MEGSSHGPIWGIIRYLLGGWAVPAGPSSKAVPMQKLPPWTLRPVITFPLIIVRRLAAMSGWRFSGRYVLFTCTVAWSPDGESLRLLLHFNTSLPRGLGKEHRYDGLASRELLAECVGLVDGGSGSLGRSYWTSAPRGLATSL